MPQQRITLANIQTFVCKMLQNERWNEQTSALATQTEAKRERERDRKKQSRKHVIKLRMKKLSSWTDWIHGKRLGKNEVLCTGLNWHQISLTLVTFMWIFKKNYWKSLFVRWKNVFSKYMCFFIHASELLLLAVDANSNELTIPNAVNLEHPVCTIFDIGSHKLHHAHSRTRIYEYSTQW